MLILIFEVINFTAVCCDLVVIHQSGANKSAAGRT
jgi:hypothetical protein